MLVAMGDQSPSVIHCNRRHGWAHEGSLAGRIRAPVRSYFAGRAERSAPMPGPL
jgi:hypothetical protein